MANPEQEDILYDAMVKQDVEIWNQWRRNNPDVIVDLRYIEGESWASLAEADLSNAKLLGADFQRMFLDNVNLFGADLTSSNLRKTYLESADLRSSRLYKAYLVRTILNYANLDGANLAIANLAGASITNANLSNVNLSSAILADARLIDANLTNANLTSTNFQEANLTGTDFNSVTCSQTIFADVDLSQVKNLATVKHLAPSTIGIDTLYKSGGNIPEIFLRGCGVPDDMIAFAKSLRQS